MIVTDDDTVMTSDPVETAEHQAVAPVTYDDSSAAFHSAQVDLDELFGMSEPVVYTGSERLMRSDTEIVVLSAAMQDETAREILTSRLSEHHFTSPARKTVFKTIQSMAERLEPVDIITVAEKLESQGLLQKIGELQYLGDIARQSFAPQNADAYADLLNESYTLRNLSQIGTEINKLSTSSISTIEKVEKAESLMMRLTNNISVAGPVRIGDAIGDFVNTMEDRLEREGDLIGLSTGLTDLDEVTSGLQSPDLIIVAGRPSQGKTTLAENMFTNVTSKQGKVGLFFSLEMDKTQVIERMFASSYGVDLGRIRKAELFDDEWAKLTLFIAEVQKMQAFVDDTAELSISEIRARSRAIKRKHGLDLIVVDYLQLVTGGQGDNLNQKVGDISGKLKGLAKELGVPVVVLSQLNRGVDSRADKRPVMSDLRESGSIEQDADIIIFVYRDEYYNPDTDAKGVAELLCRKNRNGPVGDVFTKFEGKHVRFKSMNSDSYYEEYGKGGFHGTASPDDSDDDAFAGQSPDMYGDAA